MKFPMTVPVSTLLLAGGTQAFAPQRSSRSVYLVSSTPLQSSNGPDNIDRMTEILKEEAGDPMALKAASEQMKNLKPEDIDNMVKEMENMNPFQKQALKALGMDADTMKQTMNMMKDNPQMIESAQKLMSQMTPEQMMEQSRMAQQRMKDMTPEQIAQANAAMGSIPKEALDEAVSILSSQQQAAATTSDGVVDAEIEDSDKPSQIATGPGTSSDSKVIDAMFQVGVVMSDEGISSGATLAGFAALPVIQLLRGDKEEDLSNAELKECWANGSLGATRVDRAGFGRVWKEVQDYFEDDIMGEARKEAKRQMSPKKRRGAATASVSAPVSLASPTSTIGENMSKQELDVVNERVKNMNDDEVSNVLDAMSKPDAAQEARLRSMGVDPTMMQNTAKMLQSNPMMAKAAKEMMKNMSPDDMLKMSQQAQEQMKNMTPEQAQQALKDMEEQNKKAGL